MVVDGVSDLNFKVWTAFLVPEDQKVTEIKKLKETVYPQQMGYFENLLKANGNNNYFVGSKLSLADLAFFNLINSLEVGFGGALKPEISTTIAAHRDAVAARPRIAAWIASRPASQF